MKPLYTTAFVLIFLGLNLSTQADTLILKNGNKIEGIVTKKGKKYIVEFSSGTMKVPENYVEQVKESDNALKTFRSRHEQIEDKGAQAHFELGKWASSEGLRKQAEREFVHAIQRNPDHQQARKALGYVKYNGQWMTEKEKMRKKGYVKYEGEWMTPEVKQSRLEAKRKRERREEKIQELKEQLEASRKKISQLQDQVRNLRNDLRVAQTRRRRYRYVPIFTNRSRFGRHKKQDPHHNLFTRKDNGNTVVVEHSGNGEVWKEITSDGKRKIIHQPGDGHTVQKNGDHSKLLRRHKNNSNTDIELVHPKHHD